MNAVILVQAFTACRWGVIADTPMEVDTEDQAYRMARRLAETKPGALAIFKWQDRAEVIASFGDVPDSALDNFCS